MMAMAAMYITLLTEAINNAEVSAAYTTAMAGGELHGMASPTNSPSSGDGNQTSSATNTKTPVPFWDGPAFVVMLLVAYL